MKLQTDRTTWGPAMRLAVASASVSVLLAAGLAIVHFVFQSQLALAQAADSVSDVFMAAALGWAIRVAAEPPDAEHPAGHHRAEPLAALLTAFVAGVLAVEVIRGALGAILGEARVELGWPLVVMFAAKVIAKSVIAFLAHRRGARVPNPVLRALHVDARNDVAVGSLAVLGFFAARYGWAGLDAWLALPVGLWIGAAGVELARENVRLLMGVSVEAARRDRLAAIAQSVDGVLSVHAVRALHHGAAVEVVIHVVVEPTLSLHDAHAIGHAVEQRLTAEPDVSYAVAHIDVENDE